MKEAGVVKWLFGEGNQVCAGDLIVEIETDKVVTEIEAPHDCVIREILVPEGTVSVAPNTTLAIVSRDDWLDEIRPAHSSSFGPRVGSQPDQRSTLNAGGAAASPASLKDKRGRRVCPRFSHPTDSRRTPIE